MIAEVAQPRNDSIDYNLERKPLIQQGDTKIAFGSDTAVQIGR